MEPLAFFDKRREFLGVCFSALFCPMHVMVMDASDNALSLQVSIHAGINHLMPLRIWLRCSSEGLGWPLCDTTVRVCSHKRRGAYSAAQEGLVCILIGGGLGIAKGPLPVLHW